jgi:dTDP-glucose pyrophosphorylase/predicted transcriptional regulator
MNNEIERLWTKTILRSDASVHDAIRVLNEASLRIALVLDENRKLLGTISDGDVRRAILDGRQLDISVTHVMNRNAIVVSENETRETVLELMQLNGIHQIPIHDQSSAIVGLHIWDELNSVTLRPNVMMIMAGGRGTRLMPNTEDCPKPMLTVSGKPILEHIIVRAKKEGIHNFVISINYLGNVIESYFLKGDKWGVSISYVKEEHPLGTAGALSLLKLESEYPLIVTNGDVITDIKYGEMLAFHEDNQAFSTMAVYMHSIQNPYGVVTLNKFQIVNYEEKPVYRSYINAGVYVLNAEALDFLDENVTCDMPDLFQRIRDDGRTLLAFPTHENWIDVGRHEDLEHANRTISSKL